MMTKIRTSAGEEIARFDPSLPIEEAWTPPASWYRSSAIAELERERVFHRHWIAVGPIDRVQKPGDFFTGEIAGEPYVVVRGEDGELRAFFNVCRHHATGVARGFGCAEKLVCPYHAWTYGLDGRLLKAPELGKTKNFRREDFGLVPMEVRVWGPICFVSLAEDPRPLDADLAPLLGELERMRFHELSFVERKTYRIPCNWKVFVDNYLDGGYHVPHMHRGLAAELDFDSYETELFDRHSVQRTGADSERLGSGAAYAFIHPNFMINRYGDMMDTNLVLPLGENECEVVFDYFFEPKTARSVIDESLVASDVVQQEDIEICVSVQKGLGSRAYDRGRYSSTREMAMLHFHQLLYADLTA